MSSLRIVFRVDASSQIGTGHVMRCITLANSLVKQGAMIRFVARHMPEHLQALIKSYGFELSLLSSAIGNEQLDEVVNELGHAQWLGVSQLSDAEDAVNSLKDKSWDWLIVDHYALDICWEKTLRNSVSKIMVIDDIADRSHDCDILLDQNYYTDMPLRYQNKVPSHCRLLLGPKYALLRDEFIEARKNLQAKDGVVKRVLVFFGGVDSYNYTGKAIQALSALSEYKLDVDVVIGASHPKKDEVINSCKLYDYHCHVQTNKMAELMAGADLVIGAGGAATWEKFCLGLPSITLPTADNQIKQLNDLAANGYCYVIQSSQNMLNTYKLHIKAVIENPNLTSFLAKNCMTLVDGLGVARITTALTSNSLLKMRRVTIDDEQAIHDWRNHPVIRAVSKNKELIAWPSHQSWFKDMLENPNVVMLIAELNKAPAAVARFDLQNEEAEVSIYLIQQETSRGLGLYVLQSAEQWMLDNDFNVKQLNATVLDGNNKSHQLFKLAGYQIESTYYKKVIH